MAYPTAKEIIGASIAPRCSKKRTAWRCPNPAAPGGKTCLKCRAKNKAWRAKNKRGKTFVPEYQTKPLPLKPPGGKP